jgi:chromosome segregation ATPase
MDWSAIAVAACGSSSSRRVPADGEDRSMAQTDQAWDWGVELRDEERSELELLRSTVAQLRTQLDQAHESLRSCRQRQQDASQALRQLDEARPWRRRGVRAALRERQLL